MFAPSLAGQFNATIFQMNAALRAIGFDEAVEVASGADITTLNEAKEFEERIENGAPFMTTSCCAGYNNLTASNLKEINEFKSNTATPLFYTAKTVKEKNPECVSVFISPCVAKRKEVQANDNIDYILSYSELDAFFKGRDVLVEECEPLEFENNASKQGRNYGVTGGVSAAVVSVLEDKTIAKPYIINGLNQESISELRKYANDKSCPHGNLIEVMCCEGGCIGGNATIKPQQEVKKSLKLLLEQSDDLKRN